MLTGLLGPAATCAVPFRGSAAERAYRETYRKWTRHAEIWTGINLAIEVWVTFKSADFRAAYARRYAEIYGLTEKARHALMQDETAEAARAHAFHIAAQSHRVAWSELDDPDGVWRVLLRWPRAGRVTDGTVEEVAVPGAVLKEFYPRRTGFTEDFEARFPRPEPTLPGPILLEMRGVLGKAELEWEDVGG